MESAFGVDHGAVFKSYVPGVGYKPAKALDYAERHILHNATMGAKTQRKTGKGTPEQVARLRHKFGMNRKEIWPGTKTKRGKLTRVVTSRNDTGGVEGYSQPDGRGGGKVAIAVDANFKTTSRHEMAHIKPKRNPVRMQERFSEGKRVSLGGTRTLGREEGRADYIAHGKPTPGQYPGSSDFKSGYNEVQNKMASAKRRKRSS